MKSMGLTIIKREKTSAKLRVAIPSPIILQKFKSSVSLGRSQLPTGVILSLANSHRSQDPPSYPSPTGSTSTISGSHQLTRTSRTSQLWSRCAALCSYHLPPLRRGAGSVPRPGPSRMRLSGRRAVVSPWRTMGFGGSQLEWCSRRRSLAGGVA